MDCPTAVNMLSSDPTYPLEPAVVPLVYALSCLRLVEPCWSCEGHLGPNQTLHKQPGVWFYAGSNWYPELISSHLQRLLHKRRLNHPWRVSICPMVKLNQTVFEIAPAVTDGHLPHLHRDMRTIGETLVHGVRDLSRERARTL